MGKNTNCDPVVVDVRTGFMTMSKGVPTRPNQLVDAFWVNEAHASPIQPKTAWISTQGMFLA